MDTRGLLGTPLAQFGLGAVALVLGGALLFSLIGAVSDVGDDPGPSAAGPTAPAAPDDTSPTGVASPATDPPTDAGAGTASDAPTEATTDTATEAPTDPGTEAAPAFEPGSITIQVLDGSDVAADHDAVVACLQADGYDALITGNRAVTVYATTTVFHTAGEDNRAMAEQVASVLGIGEVEEKPSNLSDTVPVHVVSGQDGTDLC